MDDLMKSMLNSEWWDHLDVMTAVAEKTGGAVGMDGKSMRIIIEFIRWMCGENDRLEKENIDLKKEQTELLGSLTRPHEVNPN